MNRSFQANSATAFTLAATAALLVASPAHADAVSGQGTWETTLQARDLDGNGVTDAFYDTDLKITWLANANANGYMKWGAANTWASNLVLGTYADWRLPTTQAAAQPGCRLLCGFNVPGSSSELAHLYFVSLGNKSYLDTSGSPQSGSGLTNTGNFQNMQSDVYWSTEYAFNTEKAWTFATYIGYQLFVDKDSDLGKGNYFYAMAVRPGDVTIAAGVPEPDTYALLLAGLGLIGAIARCRKAS